MDSLLFERLGSVAVVTINRPGAMNAYDDRTIKEMGRRFEEVDADDTIRVAILTGSGEKAFCAGADLKSLHGEGYHGGIGELWDQDRQYRLGQRVQVRKPVIAAVNGYCLAGGLELALACDLRIASKNASFGCPEVRWSILHGYGAMRLVQMIPFAAAMEMLLTGERIAAERAREIGLVTQVVEPADLLPAAIRLAEKIAANAPLSVMLTKELAWRGLYEHPQELMRFVSAAMALIHGSEDAKEGPRAFAEKRSPRFQGR